MKYHQKVRDLSYLEPEEQGRGMIAYLLQKDIEKKANLTELSQDAKAFFNHANFIYILWAKYIMPIDFK